MSDKGRARDSIAKRVGISSGRQLDRMIAVAKKRPDLMEKIDTGETTIYAAYKETVCSAAKSASEPAEMENPTEPVEPMSNDRVARAKHERLMKNPLYADLHTKHREAVFEANRAKGELRFQVEGYEKMIRGHKENICAILRERDELRAENRELRGRLGLTENDPIDVTTTIDN